MAALVLLPLVVVAILTLFPPNPVIRRWHTTRARIARAIRYRTRRPKLPDDWWEQFERDLSAYLDPLAVRAREEERAG
jgi:hypothetical protein